MAFLLAVDGFGPANGWLYFGAAIFIVVVIGGGLGLVGRKADLRARDRDRDRDRDR
jgi:hypothetical protein